MRRLVLFLTIGLLGAACSSSIKHTASSPSSTPPTSPAPTTTTSTTTTSTTTRQATPTTTAGPNLVAVKIALTQVAAGLNSPVDVAWRKGDTRMYVAEQPGRVRVVSASGTVSPTPVLTVSSLSHGNEEGLLGITFSPDGTKLYVDYTAPNNDTHVDEYTMQGDVAVPASRRQLLVQQQPFSNHKGGEVLTGPDGMLYIGLGDGGSEDDPSNFGQNQRTLLSKILRINPNASGSAPYTVPADNPFVGQSGARGETWTWGLRNPWRFSFDRANGDMWIGDVGQDKYEEVDDAAGGGKGINWGWSAREGFHKYKGAQPAGARDPVIELSHADGYCAVVGGYVYRGKAIPALDGVYLFGDNCQPTLTGAVQSGGKIAAQRDLGHVQQLTSFGEDPNGEVYVVSRTGSISRITPA